ncbi:MAG TPA: DUF4384 domain-containing protein [Polyangia bacterium]|jgi:hypothetical protein
MMTRPSTELGRSLPEGCLSDRALDLQLAGAHAGREAIDTHLASCDACAARYRGLQAARAAFPLEAPPFERLVPARRRRWWWGLAPVLAVAAMVVLIARPRESADGERAKGGDTLGFSVLHAGAVREGARGEIVHPGDRLQLVTTTSSSRFLAVLERDADGRTSVFFPREAHAARQPAGRGVALPYSVQLDATLGVGTLFAVFCDAPVAVAPLRDAVERLGAGAAWPPGCHVDSLAYETKAP